MSFSETIGDTKTYGVLFIIYGIVAFSTHMLFPGEGIDYSFGDLDLFIVLWNIDLSILEHLSFFVFIIGGALMLYFTIDDSDSSESMIIVTTISVATVGISMLLVQNAIGFLLLILSVCIYEGNEGTWWYYPGWFFGIITFLAGILTAFFGFGDAFVTVSQESILASLTFILQLIINAIALIYFLSECLAWDLV